MSGSGTKNKKTGAFTVYDDTNRFHCFACGKNGDTFDLISFAENIPYGKPLFERAAEIFNVSNTNTEALYTPTSKKTNGDSQEPMNMNINDEQQYNNFISQCKAETANHDYYIKRGLSAETIIKYNLGMSSNYFFYTKAGKRTPDLGKAAIIPYPGINYYITRLIEPPQGWDKYIKIPGQPEPLFNAQALYKDDNDVVFVVEGQLDALSLMDVSAVSIALGSTGNYTKLIKQLEKQPTTKVLVISLDNDEAGKNFTDKIKKELDRLTVPYVIANTSGDYNDPNEALTKDRELFNSSVQAIQIQAANQKDIKKELVQEEKSDYVTENRATKCLLELLEDIEAANGERAIKTNFPKLDESLAGGLYAGLYAVGAVPSLGKTSFVLQIADSIAKNGIDVLVFSLEMAKRELIAKSISREYSMLGKYIADKYDNMSTRTILSCLYPPDVKPDIVHAVTNYREYSDNVYIIEGVGDISTTRIREEINKHIQSTGKKPVVFIDYLQLLSPSNEYQSEKQNMDTSVMELKRISRDFSIPVVAVSSFSRQNYTKSANMASVKESGGIEYSCDCLIGLQYKGTSDDGNGTDFVANQMGKDERNIELVILKNRNGVGSIKIEYRFYAVNNSFSERG